MFKVFKFAALVAAIALFAGCATKPPPKDALLWKGRSLATQVSRTHQSLSSVDLETLAPMRSGVLTETAEYRGKDLVVSRRQDS